MKKLIAGLLFFLGFNAFGIVHMTRVEPDLFIHQSKTDFSTVEIKDPALKEKLVGDLFRREQIDHFGSKAYDGENADFDKYYKAFQSYYKLIDMNADGEPELVFSGLVSPYDDKEHFEIFSVVHSQLTPVYKETGHLLAYKIQSNTKEILLYHHQYPCCENASHNLNRVRLIKGKIKTQRYYFLGRDSGMVGPFFPKKVKFTSTYKESKNGFHLYWSPAKVKMNAWQGRNNTNEIAVFGKTSVYTVLAIEKKWKFVLVKAAPELDKKNRVINTENFRETYMFGWMASDEN